MTNTSNHPVAGRAKAVAYARVATSQQTDKDPRLAAQIEAIRRYAQDHGLALAGEFIDRDRSGMDDNRPGLRQMFQEILQPSSEVGTIIVTDHSRFMRDAAKARVHEDMLRERGIQLVAIEARS